MQYFGLAGRERRNRGVGRQNALYLFEYASALADNGEVVVALFNYDRRKSVSVRVGARTVEVAPLDVVFVKGNT